MTDQFGDAVLHYEKRQYEESEFLLRKLLAHDPKDVPTISLLATVLLQSQGPTAEAESLTHAASRLAPDNLDLLNNLGSLYWAQSRFPEALDCFETIVRSESTHTDAWHNYGKTLAIFDRAKEAEHAFITAQSLDTSRVDIRNSFALFLHHRGRSTESIEVLKRTIDLSPKSDLIYANLGLVFQSLGQNQEAIEAYLLAIECNDNNGGAYVNLAHVYRAQKEYDAALSTCRKAIIKNPSSALAYNGLGAVFREMNEVNNAIASFETAKKLDPSLSEVAYNLGSAYFAAERYEDAKVEFEEVLAVNPNWSTASLNLANSYVKLSQFELGIEQYTKTIECGPSPCLPATYTYRGLMKTYFSQWESAIDDYKSAIRELPDYASAHFYKSVADLRLGRFESGWREYEWRFAAKNAYMPVEGIWAKPEWDGNPFPGRSLLIHHEQGLGDAIHFSRYIPLVKKLGGRVSFRCGPPLFRLFEYLLLRSTRYLVEKTNPI